MTTLPERPDFERHRRAVEAARAGHDTVVIGCGNLLRGDDAAGPVVVRMLWERGLDTTVRLVDGGTAGMDVGFAMRGAARVVLIDACRSGAEAGALFRVPGHELEDLPDLRSLHSHSFRWDHALAFARWLLKDDYPRDIEVWLIEAADVRPGAELSPPVTAACERLVARLVAELGEPETRDLATGAAQDRATDSPLPESPTTRSGTPH